jgi:hypothetical protein
VEVERKKQSVKSANKRGNELVPEAGRGIVDQAERKSRSTLDGKERGRAEGAIDKSGWS